jgi:asparagine synthase (glutamine-hydrolysing)
MCGISGIIAKTNRDYQQAVSLMAKSIAHRGPDAEGAYQNGRVYLRHNRLSIIDLSREGNQPLYNEDKTLALVYNGEIYNYRELREVLGARGHTFVSHTDSEVIIHSYEEYGDECVSKFRGMFAFAIYNLKTRELFLARDRLGIKPLYYLNNQRLFAFCSEAKGFLALDSDDFSAGLSEESIRKLLLFPFIPDNRATVFKDIYKLEPGHLLKYSGGNILIKPYWQLGVTPEASQDFSDACQEVEGLLIESVRLRLHADVPVGILLSGGLDSSLIAAMAKLINRDVRTFTVGYDHPWDERPFAEEAAAHIGCRHTSLELEPREINEGIESVIPVFDDLSTLDAGILSIYFICQKIRENTDIKVVLVGEGADEVFGGYSWFAVSQQPFKIMPQSIKTLIHYYAISRRLSLSGFNLMRDIYRTLQAKDIFNRVAEFETKYQLPNSYLMKVDKATMAHSLEARVPFLDHHLVEKAFTLPSRHKIEGGWSDLKAANEKYILRVIARKYLPRAIAARKKRGFPMPIPLVLKSNLEKVRGYLSSSNAIMNNFVGRKKIKNLFDFKTRAYSPIEKEKENLLWKLYLIEAWHRFYISGRQGYAKFN